VIPDLKKIIEKALPVAVGGTSRIPRVGNF